MPCACIYAIFSKNLIDYYEEKSACHNFFLYAMIATQGVTSYMKYIDRHKMVGGGVVVGWYHAGYLVRVAQFHI